MSTNIEEVLVPAAEGRGVYVTKGQLLDIIDVEGHQVGDIIAWFRNNPAEYMSPTHTVSSNASVVLKTGSKLFSNFRNPVFTILRDDVEKHDIIVPCCDHERYFNDYGLTDHPHCLGNLYQARDLLGEDRLLQGETAWNVFMHNRVEPDGSVITDRAAHEAGATITLEAHEDLVVLLSSCPQDLTPCNDFNPTSMMLRVRDPE